VRCWDLGADSILVPGGCDSVLWDLEADFRCIGKTLRAPECHGPNREGGAQQVKPLGRSWSCFAPWQASWIVLVVLRSLAENQWLSVPWQGIILVACPVPWKVIVLVAPVDGAAGMKHLLSLPNTMLHLPAAVRQHQHHCLPCTQHLCVCLSMCLSVSVCVCVCAWWFVLHPP